MVKHAAASRVSITLMSKERAAVVVVEDNGRGFDPAATREGALGLAGMRERLALVDGSLTVESSPGSGTTVVGEAPLRPRAGV